MNKRLSDCLEDSKEMPPQLSLAFTGVKECHSDVSPTITPHLTETAFAPYATCLMRTVVHQRARARELYRICLVIEVF
jgi:hypothetical protein